MCLVRLCRGRRLQFDVCAYRYHLQVSSFFYQQQEAGYNVDYWVNCGMNSIPLVELKCIRTLLNSCSITYYRMVKLFPRVGVGIGAKGTEFADPHRLFGGACGAGMLQ
jgi:hypothetical protein